MSTAPLIFCHYGNADYLYYTLHAARLSNPNRRVVLIGDELNKEVALKAKVEHCFFADLENKTDLIKDFDNVYQHIAGAKHGKEGWLKFVFKRWFFVHAFLKKESLVSNFWHFDSDTLLFTDLSSQEYKFLDYDCTEQCNGSCMNGHVRELKVLENYLGVINGLFSNQNYVESQKKEFEKNTGFAFTEMRAYKYYKDHHDIKVIKLNSILDQETFDDAICQEHNLELHVKLIGSKRIKKVYSSKRGALFCKKNDDGTLVKMNSLNMSWVPTYLYEIFIKQSWLGKGTEANSQTVTEQVTEVDVFSPTLKMRIKYNLGRIKNYALIHRKMS